MSFRRYYQKPTQKATERRPASDTCPAYITWLHREPCCATGVRTGELIEVPGTNGKPWKVRAIIEAAHLKSRGTFGPDLQAIADEHTRRFLKIHPEYAA